MLKMSCLLTETFFKPWILSGHVHTVTHTRTVLQLDAVSLGWTEVCLQGSPGDAGVWTYNFICMT